MKKLLLLLLVAAISLSADILKLKNGKVYEGKAKINKGNVTIVVGENLYQFAMKDLDEINGEKIVTQANPTVRIATSEGDMIVDEISSLNLYLKDSSSFSGAINSDGQSGDVYV